MNFSTISLRKRKEILVVFLYSQSYWFIYFSDGSQLWIVADKKNEKIILEKIPCALEGYFDGSFLNMSRFPTDASIYLLLWDPR